MKATAMDSLSDTVSTALVLAATVISQFTGLLLDGWFGILVGLFILYTGASTIKEIHGSSSGAAAKGRIY